MSPISKKKICRFAVLNGSLLAIALVYAAVYTFAPGPLRGLKVCFVREVFGFYCPGCGGSRSLLALLRFQIGKSFAYYPALPYTVLVILGYDVCLLSDAWRGVDCYTKKYPKWLWAVIPLLVFLTFVVRNILLQNGIDTLGNFS